MSPLRLVLSVKIDMTVNEVKTKYMLSMSGDVTRKGSQITANSCNFDVVKQFM